MNLSTPQRTALIHFLHDLVAVVLVGGLGLVYDLLRQSGSLFISDPQQLALAVLIVGAILRAFTANTVPNKKPEPPPEPSAPLDLIPPTPTQPTPAQIIAAPPSETAPRPPDETAPPAAAS